MAGLGGSLVSAVGGGQDRGAGDGVEFAGEVGGGVGAGVGIGIGKSGDCRAGTYFVDFFPTGLRFGLGNSTNGFFFTIRFAAFQAIFHGGIRGVFVAIGSAGR